ncbi:hypothetical protein ZWY2020_037884 [Hordeum vulgare]|nr:hypothetical protein ZWY2020_037884 [Hordeum vulgare]
MGMIASDPYTRKNGVKPVDWLGVVWRLHNTADSSSIQLPADLTSGATSLGLMPARIRQLALSTWPFGGDVPAMPSSGCLPWSDEPGAFGEVGVAVGDDVVGDAISNRDVHDELDGRRAIKLLDRSGFDPLGEFVDGYQEMSHSTTNRLEGSYHAQPPYGERP